MNSVTQSTQSYRDFAAAPTNATVKARVGVVSASLQNEGDFLGKIITWFFGGVRNPIINDFSAKIKDRQFSNSKSCAKV